MSAPSRRRYWIAADCDEPAGDSDVDLDEAIGHAGRVRHREQLAQPANPLSSRGVVADIAFEPAQNLVAAALGLGHVEDAGGLWLVFDACSER